MKVTEQISRYVGKYMAFIVLAVAVAAFFVPSSFRWATPHVTLLLGIIMFGMGLTLKPDDFKVVSKRPKDVLIGLTAHYIIMPLVACILVFLFRLPTAVALGVILVGCCPSGTSSNVMCFLAKGDVALSVGVSAVSTLLAPVATPFLVWLIARKWVAISFFSMFLSILEVIIVPIVLGLLVHKVLKEKTQMITGILPTVSVLAIVLIVGGVVSTSASRIFSTGLVICAVVILHNLSGYAWGYLAGKLFGLELPKRKAICFEVGMQNSGLAVSLASTYFSPDAAIAGAIFSVWHNISGSIVANFMANRVKKSASPSAPAAAAEKAEPARKAVAK